jgi:hypothetical protein
MTTLHCQAPDCTQVFTSGSVSIGVTRRQAHIGGWRTTPRPVVEWVTESGIPRMRHSDWCVLHAPPAPWCYMGEDETGHWAKCGAYQQQLEDARKLAESKADDD